MKRRNEISQGKPARSKFGCRQIGGEKYQQKIHWNQEQVQLVRLMVEYLFSKGFTHGGRILAKPAKESFSVGKIRYYQRYLRSEKIDVTKKEHLSAMASLLAHIHKCGEGFKAPRWDGPVDRLPSVGESFNYGSTFMEEKHQTVLTARNRNNFDKCFLDSYDYYKQQCDYALELLEQADSEDSTENTHSEDFICYPDISREDVRLQAEKGAILDNYMGLKIGVPVYDLACLLNKVLPLHNWSRSVAINMVVEYEQTRDLEKAEKNLLLACLYFPYRYWQVVYRYYKRQLPEETKLLLGQIKPMMDGYVRQEKNLLQEIKKVLKAEENRHGFLNKFRDFLGEKDQ